MSEPITSPPQDPRVAPDAPPSPELPEGEPATSSASSLLGGLLMLILVVLGGLLVWFMFDEQLQAIVLPAPSGPPAATLDWEDWRLNVLAEEALGCDERVSQLLSLSACDQHRTPIGAVVRCPLEGPYSLLSLACGVDAAGEARERLWLEGPPEALGALRVESAGWWSTPVPCQARAVGPAGGEAPRWPDDLGAAACFLSGGFRAPGGGSGERFPYGVFFEYDAAAYAAAAPEGIDALAPRALVIDTLTLDEGAEAVGLRVRQALFTREVPRPPAP